MKHITAEADLRIAEPVGASFGVTSKLRRNIAEEEEELRRLRLVLGVYRGVQGNIFDLRFVQVTTMVLACSPIWASMLILINFLFDISGNMMQFRVGLHNSRASSEAFTVHITCNWSNVDR